MWQAPAAISIPPGHLLKASLLIARYSVRSERQFREQLGYNLLFKWFLDLNVDEEPFDASTFSKNRERLLEADVARAFLAEVMAEARRRRLLSAEHFSMDGTLLEAGRRSGEPPPGGGRHPEVDFRGQQRRSWKDRFADQLAPVRVADHRQDHRSEVIHPEGRAGAWERDDASEGPDRLRV